jgi:hypothetical protein
LPEQVAEAIAHWGTSADPDARLLVPQPVDPADAPLYTPTHENRLRVIGRQLDLDGYSAINLSETVGGFIVRALRKDALTPVVLEFSDRDFPLLVREAIATVGTAVFAIPRRAVLRRDKDSLVLTTASLPVTRPQGL